jgi:hypothetical protein
MFLCVYTLLSGKTSEVYLRMLNEITFACLNIKQNFDPKIFMNDFGSGAIAASVIFNDKVFVKATLSLVSVSI